MGTGWYNAAAYAIGAVISFAAVLTGSSLSYISGSCASANLADQNDLALSLKSSYRAGVILGTVISAAGLIVLCCLFLTKRGQRLHGLCYSSGTWCFNYFLILHSGGRVYSSSYSLAEQDNDFVDASGLIYASGADFMESYVISAASVIMMADLAVATSGITSTFTSDAAAKFPLIIYAVGLVASVIGTLFFRVRSTRRRQETVTLQ